jgi:hypothetical protein
VSRGRHLAGSVDAGRHIDQSKACCAPRQLKRGREQHWVTMLKINQSVASHLTRLLASRLHEWELSMI